MSRASRKRNRSTRSRAALSIVARGSMSIHQAPVMLPHPAQVALVHGEAAGAAIGQSGSAVEPAADELPIIPLGADAALIALHDLDVGRGDQPCRTEAELVLPETRLV